MGMEPERSLGGEDVRKIATISYHNVMEKEIGSVDRFWVEGRQRKSKLFTTWYDVKHVHIGQIR